MPGRRSGEGALCRPDRNGGRSLLWIVWTAWTAPCCSLALWAVCFPVLRNRSPPMHAPERWPYGEIESWWAWRDHLDRVQDPHIATLKREADCEIARILRCCKSRWEPKRPWCRGGWGPGAGADGRSRPAPWPSIARRRERVRAAFFSSLSRRRDPAAPTPSTIRSSRAFKHPNGAALRIAPLFGPALSDHVRAGPFSVAGGRRRRSWASPYLSGAAAPP